MSGKGSAPDGSTRVVIAGGGVAGLEAAIALHELAGHRVETTVLTPDESFVYRPLSVGEPFSLGPTREVPLAEVAQDLGLRHRQAALASVDTERHIVTDTLGTEVPYDYLLAALGAIRVPVYEHAITFRGQEDSGALRGLVLDVEAGYSHQVTFIVPSGVAWSLPIYELALMTARRADEMSLPVEIAVVTPEPRPLDVFGPEAAAEVEALLEEAGIRLHVRSTAEVPAKGRVVLHPGGAELTCERIVALPRIEGRAVDGLPADCSGFIPVDGHMRVSGLDDVYAAGDGATFPIKQGGLACQQADVAANDIARRAGIPIEVEPFRPILRGQLLTGQQPHFLRRDFASPEASATSGQLLWWPPAKVAGRYLAPYLGAREARDCSGGSEEGTSAATAALEDGQELNLGSFKFAER